MLWSRKVRQLTISFRDLARSKLWDGRRVGSVAGQSAPGVHSHNPYSCPSKTFINGRRNSNVSTWIKLSARFKTFLNQDRWCMWTKVVMEGQVLSLKTCLFARGSYKKNVLSSSKRSHFRLSICNLLPAANPSNRISDKAGEIFKRKSLLLAKCCQHICFQTISITASVYRRRQ